MSDNRKRYNIIKQALKQLYPGEPKGNQARHLNTLAAMISGIVGSRSSQLPAIAGKAPDGTKKESRVKRYYRWLKNTRIEQKLYFLPYACELLAGLALRHSLLLAMDGSTVGRGCMALMISYATRTSHLPLRKWGCNQESVWSAPQLPSRSKLMARAWHYKDQNLARSITGHKC